MERSFTLIPPDGRDTKRYPNGYPRIDTIRGPWWWYCAAGVTKPGPFGPHSHYAIPRCHESNAKLATVDITPCSSPEQCGWEYRPDLA